MSEAYLFASAEADTPDAALQDLLRKVGARPAWLNELHWLGAPAPQPPADRPFFPWPEAPLLPFFALQSVLRNLESAAADLTVLGQSGADGVTALLLGSPVAVGRWNLPPLARLQPLPSPAASLDSFASAALRLASARLPEEAALSLACFRGVSSPDLPADLPLLTDPPADALACVARLVGHLAAARQDFALLAETSAQAGLAFLVERV